MRNIKLLPLLLFLLACKKDKPQEPTPVTQLSNGVLVLCEGLFQQNNSTMSWIDLSGGDVTNQFFLAKANRELGDTGNDLQRYGGKVYIVVNVSSTIEVMDARTLEPIKQISMIEGGVAKQPRYITFDGSKAYVSCYDGYVDVIDTTSLNIEQRILVGPNPEGLAISNNKLYVANSGGLNYPNMDSTLSVVDLSSNLEVNKITVGLNPGRVVKDSEGDIYVIARGNYGAVPSRLVRVNAVTDQTEETFTFDASGIEAMNDRFLIPWQNASGTASGIALFDPLSEQLTSSSFLSTAGVTTLYNVQYDPGKDRIYVMDAMSYTNTGYVRVYSSSAVHLTNYHVGLNPSRLVFYE